MRRVEILANIIDDFEDLLLNLILKINQFSNYLTYFLWKIIMTFFVKGLKPWL